MSELIIRCLGNDEPGVDEVEDDNDGESARVSTWSFSRMLRRILAALRFSSDEPDDGVTVFFDLEPFGRPRGRAAATVLSTPPSVVPGVLIPFAALNVLPLLVPFMALGSLGTLIPFVTLIAVVTPFSGGVERTRDGDDCLDLFDNSPRAGTPLLTNSAFRTGLFRGLEDFRIGVVGLSELAEVGGGEIGGRISSSCGFGMLATGLIRDNVKDEDAETADDESKPDDANDMGMNG